MELTLVVEITIGALDLFQGVAVRAARRGATVLDLLARLGPAERRSTTARAVDVEDRDVLERRQHLTKR